MTRTQVWVVVGTSAQNIKPLKPKLVKALDALGRAIPAIGLGDDGQGWFYFEQAKRSKVGEP